MPFDLLALVEKDETLATCQCFNDEVCYGSGLQYSVAEASAAIKSAVEDFTLENDLAAYFLGISQEFARSSLALLRGQEAINMICFAMRVHSNLVGSVPGKVKAAIKMHRAAKNH